MPAEPSTDAPVRIVVVARPGASAESIAWDPWRNAWQVRVRAPAVRGEANRAILEALVRWLAVEPAQLRWVRAGTASTKTAEVVGLEAGEVEARLRTAAAAGRAARPQSSSRRGAGGA